MKKRRTILLAAVLAVIVTAQSCATLGQIASALVNLQRLKFKLGSVHNFALLGISLGGKTRLTDFTVADGVRLFQAFGTKRFPAEFVLDVLAINPNDGTGGSKQTVSTLSSLESRLLIDDKPTITGNIDSPIDIPGTGQQSVIPIRLGLDLYEFFGQGGYNDVIGLALAIGGKQGSSSRLSLDALPRVSTPFGSISSPRLTIVSHEFR